METARLDLEGFPPGSHIGFVYDQDEVFCEVLSGFVSRGLELGEKIVCVCGDRDAAALLEGLRARGCAPERMIAEGRVELLTPAQAYLEAGRFQPDATVALLADKYSQALQDGFVGLRVSGGAGEQGFGDWLDRVLEYECKLNEFIEQRPVTILCRYDRRKFDVEILLGVLRTHPVVAVGREVFDNFYYYPPDELRADNSPKSTFDRWVETLRRFKRMGEAVAERESLLRRIIESSHDGIALVDERGLVVEWNPAMTDICGTPREKALGRPVDQVIGEMAAEWERTVGQGGGEDPGEAAPAPFVSPTSFGRLFETKIERADGRTRRVQTSIFPVDSRGRKLVGAILRDVTALRETEQERRRFEEKLRETQKLESLGLLAGGIAHDFNNLLVGILGNAGLALEELSATSPAREAVQDIETAARRAADLARQLLAYSGRGRFLVEPIDLAELVQEMVHLLHASIPKNVIIKLDFVYRPAIIKADVVQIRQVVMNLVTNAAEAIGTRSGVITVATGAMNCDRAYLLNTFGSEDLQPGDYVYLEVSDTGCGMDEATLARIFDPFFSTKFAGRGLGLAATLGIVRGHKGAIRVYSEPGRGTTFKLLFPATDASLGIKPPERTADEEVTGTVLVVDDEEWVRAVARRVLERVGFRVMTASDGLEGVRVYRENVDEVDVVLLDMTMPHLNGEETFREMRRVKRDVRVILSSGYNEQEAVGRFAGRGLAGFIQKPYSPSELVELIRRTLLRGAARGDTEG